MVSAAADAVRGYNLGTIFEPGNPDSLERAVGARAALVDAADLERARTELSNRAGRGAVLGHVLRQTPPADEGRI